MSIVKDGQGDIWGGPVKMDNEQKQKLNARRKIQMEISEDLLQRIDVQNVESQSFAIKSLTNIFLSEEFGDSVETMRYHLQVLRTNQEIIQELMQLKLNL